MKGRFCKLYIRIYINILCIKPKLLGFSESYSAVLTKKYWAVEKEESANMTIFVIFTLSELNNIRVTYSKYFQNIVYETDISSTLSDQLPYAFLHEFIYIQ